MPMFVESCCEIRPAVRIRQTDGGLGAEIEMAKPRNPYALAQGLKLSDVPGVIAAQYSAYPNPHLIAAIKVCEAVADIVVSPSVHNQRLLTLRAIRLRDIGLYLATCLKSGVLGSGHEDLCDTAISIARAGRQLEQALAGSKSEPKLFFGGANAPNSAEVVDAIRQLPNLADIVHFSGAFFAKLRRIEGDYSHLTVNATMVCLDAAVFPSNVAKASFHDSKTVFVGPTPNQRMSVTVTAPRGELTHSLCMNDDGQTVSGGSVLVPTEVNMASLERVFTHLLRTRFGGDTDRDVIERNFTMLARTYNPCGLDLSGDFLDFIWE